MDKVWIEYEKCMGKKMKSFFHSYLTMHKIVLLIFMLMLHFVHAQQPNMAVNLQGMLSSEDKLPFWMYSNQRGRITEETNFAAWINFNKDFSISKNWNLQTGAGLLYNEEREKLQTDELFIGIHNKTFNFSIGRKQRSQLYNGLSAANENILWSLNARPLSGVSFKTIQPIFIFKKAGVGFELEWEEFLLDDDRHVQNARLHHKRFNLVYEPTKHIQFKVGLQHFVQWAGNSATAGKQPDSFDDYLLILTGQSGNANASESDQLNALGNNIGSYEAALNLNFPNYKLSLLWNSIFEDGSGRRLGNTPDGRYGLFIANKNPEQWINSLMYELYYTKHQSHTTTGEHKFDDYLNNGMYQSGFTYENKVLGVPFFLTSPSKKGVVNSRMIVHHFGIGGMAFSELPYKILTSYRKNYGATNPLNSGEPEPENILSTYLNIEALNPFVNMSFQLGADFSSQSKAFFGCGIRLYKLF